MPTSSTYGYTIGILTYMCQPCHFGGYPSGAWGRSPLIYKQTPECKGHGYVYNTPTPPRK